MSLSDKYTDKKADNVDSETMEFSPKLLDGAEQKKEQDLQLSKDQKDIINLKIKMKQIDDEGVLLKKKMLEFAQTTFELMDDEAKKRIIMDLKYLYYLTTADLMKLVEARLKQLKAKLVKDGIASKECNGMEED